MKPREVPSWNEYHMRKAWATRVRSKDPSTQVGCVIVTEDNTPVSEGYNGFPKGCDESRFPFGDRDLKLETIIHAEMNAILFADREKLKGATLYTTHYPCPNCLKHAFAAGIKHIVFDEDGIKDRFTKTQKKALEALLYSMVDQQDRLTVGIRQYQVGEEWKK